MREADARLLADVARDLGMVSPTVTPLPGGSRNRCYRLEEGAVDVVLRVAGESDTTYSVERDSETLAQRTAARYGFAPKLLLEDRGRRFVVMEHVPGPVWSRALARSPAAAGRLGEWLGRLHAVTPPPGLRRVCFAEVLGDYCNRLGPGPLTDALLARVSDPAGLPEPPDAPSFCHNDLHHLNLVESDGHLLAVDWEYAGTGDPLMDLAGYVAYHDLDQAAVESLLVAYAPHRGRPAGPALTRARWLFEAVWWGWLELLHREGGETRELAATRAALAGRLSSKAG